MTPKKQNFEWYLIFQLFTVGNHPKQKLINITKPPFLLELLHFFKLFSRYYVDCL